MNPEPAGFAPPDPAALLSISNTYYVCKVYIPSYLAQIRYHLYDFPSKKEGAGHGPHDVRNEPHNVPAKDRQTVGRSSEGMLPEEMVTLIYFSCA